MSTHTPQVLSRRTNAPASESTKSKATADGASRPGKAKGSAEKQAEARSTNDADPPKAPKTRTPHEGEKVIIRRLPPGMTEAECLSILGSEWAVGSGKVDWFSYAPGKASNELSKPSRPARAYLHVMRKDYIMPLSEVMSIYKKVPGTKKRVDARQGTIDQDPEFMAFLEGLANPAPPREGIENEDVEEAPETKVTTTPLIEYLKEKKANKAKEAAAAKSAKHSRQETTTTKGKSASKEDEGSKKKGKDSKNTKTEKPAPKEPVKILTKKAAAAASEKSAEAAKPAASQASTSGNAASTTEAPTPKSRRAGVSIAARMLQRDLGLSPGSAYRRARQDAAKAEAGSKSSATDKENKEISSAANENQSSPAPASTETATSAQTPAKENASKAQQPARKTRGGKNADKTKPSEASGGQNTNITPPVILKKKSGASGDADASKSTAETASATQQSNSKSASGAANGPKGASAKSSGSQKKSAAAASANATRGFVKHANSSQGITEPVLKQALEAFGTITFIEVDKRKGFAYVDFADHSGLAKAISASPISVAQGTVQVLERKDKKPAPASSGSGNAAATPSASNTASNGAAPEKSSGTGRGRRGRGGKAATATNGTPIAATSGG
ncbi:hypothetical protein TrVFT333_009813 [Trichoderma virens FT-333]|nr:hypothetical protein TrVFT333_009813 [Trichoderma virens FT-333]